jgi:hypothetical protein
VGIAVSGSDLYVADFSSGTVGQYTTSGTTINPSLITPSGRAYNLAVSGTSLFVISPEAETVYNYTTSGDFVTSWQVTNSSYPTGLAVSGSDVFVTDFGSKTVREYTTTGAIVNNALISGVSALVGMTISAAGAPTPTPTPTPPPPPHGGLSATTFTVDESTSPTSNVADTVLRFAAVQTGTPAGLSVRVQYSINGSTWTDLPDGDAGNMIYDPAIGKFITATANYLAANGTSFRAIASAKGYTDRISNVVGSFSLASSKPRLSPPIISITGNGTFADLYFRSYVAKPSGGMALRVQSSTTPVSQASWTDLSDGVLGHMKPTTDPTRYYLMDDKLPAATGVYFRVIGSLTGYVDALSTPIGPFTLISDTPPSVKVTAPHASSGSGTAASPFVYSFGPLGFVATATASGGGKVQGIGLTADGSLFGLSLTSSVTGTYAPTTIGDHTIEAIASDKLGGTSRFGTSPIYIRVIPSAKSQEKAESQVGSDFKSDATTSGTVYTQVQDSGQWTDPSTWKSSLGTAGVPGPNDLAIISGTVFLSKAVTVRSVSLVTGLNGANFAGSIVGGTKFKNAVNDLSVTGAITDHGAAVGTFPLDTIHLILASGATCDFWNTAHPITVAGCIIDNYGTFSVHGGLGVVGLTAFNNYGSTNFLPPLALPSSAGVDPTIDTRTLAADAVNTSGLINSALTSQLVGHDGASIMTLDGGSLISQDGGSLISQDGSNLIGNDGSSVVSHDGGTLMPQEGGAVVSNDGGSFSHQGANGRGNSSSGTQDNTTPSGFVQTGGETDLDGISIIDDVTLNGGVLSGTGIIEGNLTNNSGYISPGHSPGAIGINGTFVQGAKGTLVIQDGGALPNEFDQLEVAGKATLGGTLDLQLINGYKPSTLDTFSPLGYSEMAGKFATISSNATVKITTTGLNVSVNPAVPGPSPAASRNIATRAFVQTGENVIIGGFIVSGPAGSEKKVILRGIGPSLSKEGIQGALADPVLQLYKGPTLLETNDNWTSNEAAVKATGLQPTNALESAIVTTLAPGAYTVILSGKNNGTGIGLVEVYDLAPDSKALLANISTRCDVETGDNVLIGGFILEGAEPSQILVRAIGPSLTKEGVHGALADPILDLYDANGAVITNDDWRGTQEAAIIATGVAPTNDKESAILATLPPGPYTAIVSGKNGGTGVALVEVYNIQ